MISGPVVEVSAFDRCIATNRHLDVQIPRLFAVQQTAWSIAHQFDMIRISRTVSVDVDVEQHQSHPIVAIDRPVVFKPGEGSDIDD